MKKTFTIVSMLFVALIAMGGFFMSAEPAAACYDWDCGDTYYGGYDSGWYDYGYDYGYSDSYYPSYDYGYYDDYSYSFDFYYYQPPTYTPPVYTPPTYTPPTPPNCSLSASQTSVTSGTPITLSWAASNATTGFISNGVGTVSPSFGTYTVTPLVTTTYVGTFTGQGGSNTCQTTVFVQAQQPPTCSLSVSNYSNNNNQATLSWTTNNATTANIDQGIGSVSTGSGSRVVNAPNGTTTYTMNVSGQGGSATCQATVSYQYQQNYQPWCTLSISPNQVGVNQQATISWNTSPNATSFNISPNVGSVNTGSGSRVIYPNQVTTYVGTVYAPNGQSATCQTTIGVYAASNVNLFQQPGDQPLAAVSLSQVPYTGFTAGPVVTFVFWLAVILWSFGIAYIIVGKRGLQFIAERAFGYEPASVEYDTVDFSAVAPTQSAGTREDEYVNGFAHAEQNTLTGAPVPTAVPATEISVRDAIESRAHKAGILLSPEAVQAALTLSSDDEATLRIFGNIVNDAVEKLQREDGWILLSSDKFDELAAQYRKSGAPELSPNDLAV